MRPEPATVITRNIENSDIDLSGGERQTTLS
jgi:hypothetical protein